MLKDSIFYIKAIGIVVISFLTIGYLITTLDDHFIYETELNSLLLFLNDNNQSNNILTYIAELLIKVIFQIDFSDLSSIFENINPLY